MHDEDAIHDEEDARHNEIDEPSADDQPTESLEGRLLIAMPNIGDPRFERAVIYLFAHRRSGAMGLIVNRAAEGVTFDGLMRQLQLDVGENAQITTVRFGGPVEEERGFVLHSPDWHRDDSTIRVDGAVSLTATLDVLKAMASGQGPARAMFALGYAGWGPGQLESEIARNGWLHCDGDPDIVFGAEDTSKWRRSLAKLGIEPMTLSSTAGTA